VLPVEKPERVQEKSADFTTQPNHGYDLRKQLQRHAMPGGCQALEQLDFTWGTGDLDHQGDVAFAVNSGCGP
jgi:hypothetical protein